MGNSLITSGKPSQRREKRLFERLSCSYAQVSVFRNFVSNGG